MNGRRAKPWRLASRSRKALVLLVLTVAGAAWWAMLPGCGKQSVPEDADYLASPEDAVLMQQELFQFAVENLNRLEEFNSGAALYQLFGRLLSEPKPQEPAEGTNTLAAAWPELEMHHQILRRLNQWIRSLRVPPGWQPDPLVGTLPELLAQRPAVKEAIKGLGRLEFSDHDGFVLQEAVWLRDLSNWSRGDGLDDLSRVKSMFDWTVRNIQLESGPAAEATAPLPLFPWEVLLLGRGTAVERAWVFILLARQQGLPAVLLAVPSSPPPQAPAEAPKPPADAKLRPWAVGVLIGGQLCLFDPALGLPIPAPDGIRLDSSGRLDVEPATLAQVVADPGLLRQLDAARDYAYPVAECHLGQVIALVEASPGYLAHRMQLIETHLVGSQKMVLCSAPTREAERLRKLPHLADVRLWTHPYETIQRRSQLSPAEVQSLVAVMLPLHTPPSQSFRLPSSRPADGSATAAFPALLSQPDHLPSSDALRISSWEPLCTGRMLHLKGRFVRDTATGKAGAAQCYLAARHSNKQLAAVRAQIIEVNSKAALESKPNLVGQERKLAEQRLRQAAAAGADVLIAAMLRARQHASWWLGLIAYERAEYQTALDYFLRRTLLSPGASPVVANPWQHAARYNLARTYEATHEYEKAIEHYLSDTGSPGYHGNLLRAGWLKSLLGATADKTPAEPVDEPAVEEPTVEEPTVEEPTVEEPTVKEPQPDEPHRQKGPDIGPPGP